MNDILKILVCYHKPYIMPPADDALLRGRPKELILDFSGVTFMDSSGVGLVMGRYKSARALGCAVTVRGLSPRDRKIMRMSGLTSLITFI